MTTAAFERALRAVRPRKLRRAVALLAAAAPDEVKADPLLVQVCVVAVRRPGIVFAALGVRAEDGTLLA